MFPRSLRSIGTAVAAVMVVVLLGLGLGAKAPEEAAAFDAFLSAAEQPVVQVFTLFQQWNVSIKPEFRGFMPWGRTVFPVRRLVAADAGQQYITLKPEANQLFPPQAWIEGGKLICAVPEAVWVAFKANGTLYPVDQDCDRHLAMRDALNPGVDLINRADPQAISVVRGRYQIKIPAQETPAVFDVTVPGFAYYENYTWSLDTMMRSDTSNYQRLDETTTRYLQSGTGLIVYSGPLQTMQTTGRDGYGNVMWQRGGKDWQYDRQTLILTNSHVVGPVLSGGAYGVADEETGALVEASAIQGAWVYVVLNPGGKPLEARVVAADPERDLAWLSLNEPLEVDIPATRWGNVNDPIRVGEELWMVGHPLGIETPWASKGIAGHTALDSNDHVRQQLIVDGRGGSSGSPIYRAKNGLPEIVGVVYAMYGELVGNGAWEPVGKPSKPLADLMPAAEPFDYDSFVQEARQGFVGSNFMLAISLQDIVASAAENGLDIPGLSGQFEF